MFDDKKMTCPDCGVEMNHHADKLDYNADASPASFNVELGGVLEQAYTCPQCGRTKLRRAVEPST